MATEPLGRFTSVRRHSRVVIAGAGVGGLEAALALRALAGPTVAIELVSPESTYEYRALSVAEAFGYERALRVPLDRLWRTHGVTHHRAGLGAVHPSAREVELDDGERLTYDALVVAIGARQENWVTGSVCFTGSRAVPQLRDVLARLKAGDIESVAFVAPTAGWTLPVYELALQTAGWCAEEGVIGVELAVHSPEERPLEAFGRAASRTVRNLLEDRGVRFRARHAPEDAGAYGTDEVVSLPRLYRTPIAGLPSDHAGFIPVDELAAVRGVPHVWAVGDATDQPFKQGGLAAQQADAAASAIAAELGAPVQPVPFQPVLRGMLFGAMTPAFLRREGQQEGQAAFDALWWPPTKVAGRYLGPYLADARHALAAATLADRPAPEDTEAAAHDREEVRRIALDLALAEAGWGDHRSALRWLQTVEWLDGALTDELAGLRREWEALA